MDWKTKLSKKNTPEKIVMNVFESKILMRCDTEIL